MFARVTRITMPPDKVADDIAVGPRIREMVAGAPGSRGYMHMVDRATGAAMVITLWETEQELHDSEPLSQRTRAERGVATGAEMAPPEVNEVTMNAQWG